MGHHMAPHCRVAALPRDPGSCPAWPPSVHLAALPPAIRFPAAEHRGFWALLGTKKVVLANQTKWWFSILIWVQPQQGGFNLF